MKERIELLLEKQSLTPTRFADMIGLNRSAMSHIISGRNKPSLDVITKILQCFPSLNSDWLLFGKEPMFLTDESKDNGDAVAAPGARSSSLFDQSPSPHESSTPKRTESPQASVSERKIARIVIFYSDNTFETIIPDKSISIF